MGHADRQETNAPHGGRPTLAEGLGVRLLGRYEGVRSPR